LKYNIALILFGNVSLISESVLRLQHHTNIQNLYESKHNYN